MTTKTISSLDDSFWRRISFLFFFVSGFCGLVYQIVWVRMAFANFGIIPPVLSVIISVFMLGLGLGSWLSGKLAVLWTQHWHQPALSLYALTEGLVGLTAWQVPHFFTLGSRLLLSIGTMNSASYLTASAVVLGITILPTCICMGATIPIMMCHIAQAGETQTSFSFLYLANALGACCGTVLTAVALIELLGFRATEHLAVYLNLALAGMAGALVFYLPKKMSGMAVSVGYGPARAASAERRSYLWILFTTGLVSMGCEVLWTRAFTPVLGTTIYAFATVLGAFLLGTGLGSFAYRQMLRNAGPRALLSVDVLLLGVTFSVFIPVLWNDPRINEHSLGIAVSLLPFCGLLGFMTPRLVDEYAQGEPQAAGWAYAVNIVGCVIGPLVASYILLPTVGVRTGTLWLAFFLLVLMATRHRRHPSWKTTSALVSGGLLILFTQFFVHSYEEQPAYSSNPKIIRRDYAATVISCGTGMEKRLFVDGVGITILTPLTKMMAHLPVMAHAGRPQNALTICFGMGTTYRSLLSWGLHTTAVELVPSVGAAFPYYHADAATVLQNPLGTLVIDDGRRFLKRTTEHYDIITLDPPPPVETAGSGLLYSSEFYSLLQKHLKPGGIVQQWWPIGELNILCAVTRTLHESFPYVRVYKSAGSFGFHFLASMTPIHLQTSKAFIAEMPEAARQDFVEWGGGLSLGNAVQQITGKEIPIDNILRMEPTPLITDDSPYNEYYLLRRRLGRMHHSMGLLIVM